MGGYPAARMREPTPGRPLPSDRIAAADVDADRYPADNLAFWVPLLVELGGITAGQRVLDVGCATGGFTIAIAEQTHAHVVGCDRSPSLLVFAQTKPAGSVAWIAGDAQRLPFTSEAFDCVVLSLVLHQVPDRAGALTEAFRALRSPGVLVIRTILPEDLAARIPFRFLPALAQQQAALMPSLDELTGWATAAGFVRIRIRKVHRDKHLRLEEAKEAFGREAARHSRLLSQQQLDEGLHRMRTDWERAGHRWVDPRSTHFISAAKS
jgi:ubiquinone/menaquinone biosynthesis C-methylase UbiE